MGRNPSGHIRWWAIWNSQPRVFGSSWLLYVHLQCTFLLGPSHMPISCPVLASHTRRFGCNSKPTVESMQQWSPHVPYSANWSSRQMMRWSNSLHLRAKGSFFVNVFPDADCGKGVICDTLCRTLRAIMLQDSNSLRIDQVYGSTRNPATW